AWAQAYERMLRDLIRHMEGSDYAGHIIGYQPAGGRASEWYWYGDTRAIDFAPAAIERWRVWLSDRYGGEVRALREAWGRPDATFEAAQPPTPQEREATHHGLFRDPVQGRRVVDYLRFLSDMVSRNILRSCRIVKEETGGEKIAGVFYGYSLYTPRQDGFQALEQVLVSPDVDFLCSPTSYDHRRGGEPGSFVSTYFGSYRLHGKLYWDEVDTRTHLYPGHVSYRTESLDETLAVLQRAVGHSLTRGTSLWWFLLAGNATFHQAEVMDEIAALKETCDQALDDDREPVADVAVFVDEPSMYHAAGEYAVLRAYLRDTVDELARMGAPHDIYLLSDIADEHLPDYRLYIFLNAWAIDEATQAAIDAKVRRGGKVAVWVYAPGYVAGASLSEEAMAELTGITLRAHAHPVQAELAITDPAHPITASAPETLRWPWELAPAFSVADDEATVLGTVADRPALAVRELADWRSVYSLLPLRRACLLGQLGHVLRESKLRHAAHRLRGQQAHRTGSAGGGHGVGHRALSRSRGRRCGDASGGRDPHLPHGALSGGPSPVPPAPASSVRVCFCPALLANPGP
ncbi:MAG: ThuA domain-containing protein, partial [Armatimonadota bacterium]